MARPREVARPKPSRYERLVELERRMAGSPSGDPDLLRDLEAGLPVVVYGYRIGAACYLARITPDDQIEKLEPSGGAA